MHVSPAFAVYLVFWICTSSCALSIAILDGRIRREISVYMRYLLVPWKIALFVPAGLFVTIAGNFAFDDTWDYVSGGGMSLLTFITAPWAVGTLWLAASGSRTAKDAFVAIVAMLFSASWMYDGWLLVRDGYYTDMWLPNLLVSPFLYVAAGFLWNLELDGSGRPTFGFLRPQWPSGADAAQPLVRLALLSWPFVVFGAATLLGSVHWHL